MAETEPTHAGVAVIAADTGRLLMIQRKMDPEDAPEVQGTWEFPSGGIEGGETPEAAAWREFSEETGLPQPDGETVNGWRSEDGIYQGFLFRVPVEEDAFAEINPDPEAADTVDPDNPERRHPDVTAWFTVEQLQGLGAALRPEVAKMDWSIFDLEAEMTVVEAEPQTQAAWYGVLAPEGVPSGDGRTFLADALRFRNFPLPLTWQKVGSSGHDGRVTVGRIDRAWREDGVIKGEGIMLDTPEAAEVMALIGAFGRFGVSVDADDVTEVYEEGTQIVFADARVSSACIVDIPAFQEAFVALGTWEAAGGWAAPSEHIAPAIEDDMEEPCSCDPEDENFTEDCECDGQEEDIPATVAALDAEFAPGTQDGPGWLTHPVDTDRLRDYWVRGAGAAKIGWGTPGDFDRCRTNLAKYVKPQYLDGYCANRHYDALGIWPGEHSGATLAPALSLTAAAVTTTLPATWFADPGLSGPTALTLGADGRVSGHLATWGVCHIGFDGECVEAPHSASNYAYFQTGVVETDAGLVPVGNITIGGGHAGPNLSWRPALAHYDATSSVVADVAVGEDDFGIWVAGALRANVDEERRSELAASGGLSGDWREVVRGSGELELVAALAVNVGGFPVPRVQIAASGGHRTALVAAGVIAADDPVEELVDTVIARIEQKQALAARRQGVAKRVRDARAEALRARL